MYKRSEHFSSKTKTHTELCLPPWDLTVMRFFAVQVRTWLARGFGADGNRIPRAPGSECPGQITGRSMQQILHQQLRTPWSLSRHLLATSAETFRALTSNKRSAIGGSLYLSYEKKPKKTYVKWALYMWFTHSASASSEAGMDCLHKMLRTAHQVFSGCLPPLQLRLPNPLILIPLNSESVAERTELRFQCDKWRKINLDFPKIEQVVQKISSRK